MSQPRNILIQNCTLLDPATADGFVSSRSLRITNGQIAEIAVGPLQPLAGERVIEGRDLLAIPGLINAHTHSPENLLRGATEGLPLEPWLVQLYGIVGALSPEDVYLAAMLGAAEMLLSGTTAVLDHLWAAGPLTPDYLDAVMQAYADSGMRAVVAPLYSDVPYENISGEAMGFALADTSFGQRNAAEPSTAEQIAMLDEWFRHWHKTYGGRLRCFVGADAVQWCSAELLHASHDLARRHNTGVHTHLLETHIQEIATRQRFGMPAIRWLAREGLLGPHVSLAHAVWIQDDQDLDILAETGSVVVHNPAANLKLGSGVAPIVRMRRRGIPVALGCDGAASSDNQVVFEAMRLAALIHTIGEADSARWLLARDVVAMATEGGAAALGLRGQLGVLETGALADITLLDLRSPHLTPLNNAYRQLAFCESGASVHTVIVDGAVVVDNRRIVAFDAEGVLAELRAKIRGRPWQQPLSATLQAEIARFSAWRAALHSEF